MGLALLCCLLYCSGWEPSPQQLRYAGTFFFLILKMIHAQGESVESIEKYRKPTEGTKNPSPLGAVAP